MTELSQEPLSVFKYVYACICLIFSVVIVMALVFSEHTQLSRDVHWGFALVVCWTTIIWLGMVEGGQCSMVGLPPVNPELYKHSHPMTYQICTWGHKGDNLDRYLMGRQFLVVLVVFCVNISCGPVGDDIDVMGLPDIVMTIFLDVGLAMILFTTQIGQLAAQCNASHMMLDYINNYFMLFTMYVSMAIEASGLLHASYLIQLLVAALAGKTIDSNEPPRNLIQNVLFWGRCFGSLVVLVLAFTVTLTALFQEKTTVWKGIPPVISVILFFFLMSIVGLLEGMQIAFFAVSKMTKEERGSSTFAKMTCELLFRGTGRNLPGFMIGRQLCVVSCMFFIARVCTLDIKVGENNIFGVPDFVQAFLNTGLLAAVITTIVASIAWQLVASAFPLAFLSNPLVYFMLRLALLLESTGICSGAWVIGRITELIFKWEVDEFYIGTPEDRAAQAKNDKETEYGVGAGHMRVPVPSAGCEDAPTIASVAGMNRRPSQCSEASAAARARRGSQASAVAATNI